MAARMTLPNLITIGRLFLVPLVIVMIINERWQAAFVIFVAAGISDAIDGFIAKRFDMTSELGAYLDPVADKALIVSIYITLAMVGAIPSWLVILVVSRDVMIVSAVILSWVMAKPVAIAPLRGQQAQHGGAARLRRACARLARLRHRSGPDASRSASSSSQY